MNHRIKLFVPSKQVNDLGEQIERWNALATVWAALSALKLVEVNRMAGMDQAAEAKFRVRYRPNLSTHMEVEHQGKRYRVTAVEEVGNREGIDLFVRAV